VELYQHPPSPSRAPLHTDKQNRPCACARQDLEAYKQNGRRGDCLAITALQQKEALRTVASAMFEAGDFFNARSPINAGSFKEDWTKWQAELKSFAGSSPAGPELGQRVLAMSKQTLSSTVVFSSAPPMP
jgi:hypothetical protein